VKRARRAWRSAVRDFPGFRDTDEIGEFLRVGENLVDVLGTRRVGRDAECIECAESVEPIDLLSQENKVGMEGGNFFEIRIDGAADLPFPFALGRIVAVVGVPDEAILHAEGVKVSVRLGARETMRMGICGTRMVRRIRQRLRAWRCAGAADAGGGVKDCARRRKAPSRARLRRNASATHGMGGTMLHESPLTRVREIFDNKKTRRETRSCCSVPSREVSPTAAAREGLAWLSRDEAEYSGGTAAELHGTSPLPLPADVKSVYEALRRVSIEAEFVEIQFEFEVMGNEIRG